MSYAVSVQTTTATIASYARKMTQSSRPGVEIILHNHSAGKAYTTFDEITGRVNITSSHNVRFDEIRITLEGTTKTFIDNLPTTGTTSRKVAYHNWLKLPMPIRDTDYPQPRVLESGRTYTFPFNFNIPAQLLPRACSHSVAADHVHQAHLQLPPSMGDREVSQHDDLSPEMTRISYAIKAKVIRYREEDEKEAVLVEGLKKLCVVPAVVEAPPLSIVDGNRDYVLSKTKLLKKGVFSGKLGRITVSADQTNAIILPSPASPSTSPATTMATLNIRFEPHDVSFEPPKLGSLTTKIKAITFYNVIPAQALPCTFFVTALDEATRGIYHTSIPLSSRRVTSVAWTKHEPEVTDTRRDSDSSSNSSYCSDRVLSPVQESAVYYTATVLVPITLPSSKTWIPTFHSCTVSRIYTLDISLTIHTPGAGVPASSASLHLPVQIAAAGNQTQRLEMTAAEAAAELARVDEFFAPRMLEVPSEEFLENSVLRPAASIAPATTTPDSPPRYENFFSQTRAVVNPKRR